MFMQIVLHELQSRFDTFSQMSLEYRELCDETKSAMQAFQTKFDSFSHWLEGVEGKLAEKKSSKFPISTVQSQLDEHYERGYYLHSVPPEFSLDCTHIMLIQCSSIH